MVAPILGGSPSVVDIRPNTRASLLHPLRFGVAIERTILVAVAALLVPKFIPATLADVPFSLVFHSAPVRATELLGPLAIKPTPTDRTLGLAIPGYPASLGATRFRAVSSWPSPPNIGEPNRAMLAFYKADGAV